MFHQSPTQPTTEAPKVPQITNLSQEIQQYKSRNMTSWGPEIQWSENSSTICASSDTENLLNPAHCCVPLVGFLDWKSLSCLHSRKNQSRKGTFQTCSILLVLHQQCLKDNSVWAFFLICEPGTAHSSSNSWIVDLERPINTARPKIELKIAMI